MRTTLFAFVLQQNREAAEGRGNTNRTLNYVERRRTSEDVPWDPSPRIIGNVVPFRQHA